MPDLWDTNPDTIFDAPGEQPAPAASGHDDPKEARLKDTAATRVHLDRLAVALVAILVRAARQA